MNPQTRPADLPTRFFIAATAYPRTVLALSLVLLFAPAIFLPRMTVDTSREAFIPKNDPAVVNRDKIKEIFGLGDPILVGIFNDGIDGVFTPESLRLLSWYTDQLADVPGIDPEKITSLATQNDITGTDDAMIVEPFMGPDLVLQDEARAIREAVMDFELYVGSLVAESGEAALIVAELRDDANAEEVYQKIVALRDTAPIAKETVYVVGTAAVASLLGRYVSDDVRRLIPVTVMIVTLMIILALRTLRGLMLLMLVMAGAGIWSIGTMAGSATPFYIVTNGMLPILMAIAVADGLHILSQYYEELAVSPGTSSRELTVRTMVAMWRPVLVTSLTDIAGMMAIFFASFMPPMRAFGLFASVGIAIALLVSLFCIPAFLTILKPKASVAFPPVGEAEGEYKVDHFGRALDRFGGLVLAHPRVILGITVAVVGVGFAGALRLEANEEQILNINPTEPIFRADRALDAAFDGTKYIDIVIESNESEGLLDPVVLRRIEAMQVHLEGLPHVNGTVSVVDYLKQMNRAMNGDRRDHYRLPDSAALAAQYFLLYSNSGGPTDFEQQIDYDYQAGIVRVAINTGLYSEWKPIVEEADRYVAEHFSGEDGLTAVVSGHLDVQYHWISGIAPGHFRGVFLALFAVWLVATISYRSVVGGAFAILPVSIAVLVIYAVMGFGNIWLGVGTSMFAAIAIGTGIDFAVHTLDRLIALVRNEGYSVEEALARFYPSTGRALLFNFATLFLGFIVLVASMAPGLVKFGSLIGVGAVASFLASITILPALLLTLRPAFLERSNEIPARTGSRIRSAASILVIAGVWVGATLAFPARAEPPALETLPSGDEIAERINARDEGLQVIRRLTMRLSNSRGKTRTRETHSYRKYFGDEKRTILFYDSPSSTRGTGLLSIDYGDERDNDQWLYLPAARKTRRISASERGDYFLGTDFTFEDVDNEGKIELEDYTRRTVGFEQVDAHPCYVMESEPVSSAVAKELGYSRIRAWVDSKIWITRKAEYWDVQGVPLKTLHVSDISQVDGIWSIHRMTMKNQKTGHATVFEFSDFDYVSEVDDDLFTQRALRRGR